MAGLLVVFGPSAALQCKAVRKLYRTGVSKAEIARRLQIGRISVSRIPARPISRRKIESLFLQKQPKRAKMIVDVAAT